MTPFPSLSSKVTINEWHMYNTDYGRKRVIAWPSGSTRETYRDGLKKTISGLTLLRDSDCRRELGYGLHDIGYLCPWIEAPISYLCRFRCT